MLHVVVLLLCNDAKVGRREGLIVPCVVLSLVAMALPTIFFQTVTGARLSAAISADALLGAAWPIVLGIALASVLFRLRDRIPEVPAGDVFVFALSLAPVVSSVSALTAHVDRALGRWQIAGFALLGLVAVLSTVMLLQFR